MISNSGELDVLWTSAPAPVVGVVRRGGCLDLLTQHAEAILNGRLICIETSAANAVFFGGALRLLLASGVPLKPFVAFDGPVPGGVMIEHAPGRPRNITPTGGNAPRAPGTAAAYNAQATFLSAQVDYGAPIQLMFILTDAAVPGGLGAPGDPVLAAAGAPIAGVAMNQPYQPNVRIAAGGSLDNVAIRGALNLLTKAIPDSIGCLVGFQRMVIRATSDPWLGVDNLGQNGGANDATEVAGVTRSYQFGGVKIHQSSTITSALQLLWGTSVQETNTLRVVEIAMETLTAPSVSEMMARLYLQGCPYATAVAQVLRSTGLHGSSLLPANYVPVNGITEQRVSLGDLFYSVSGEATTFVEMEDRVMERLFGFCMPYSLKCSLTPDGLRVLGTLPPGFSGPGPLDAVPMFYTPTPVMPMVLPLEFRTDSQIWQKRDGNRRPMNVSWRVCVQSLWWRMPGLFSSEHRAPKQQRRGSFWCLVVQ